MNWNVSAVLRIMRPTASLCCCWWMCRIATSAFVSCYHDCYTDFVWCNHMHKTLKTFNQSSSTHCQQLLFRVSWLISNNDAYAIACCRFSLWFVFAGCVGCRWLFGLWVCDASCKRVWYVLVLCDGCKCWCYMKMLEWLCVSFRKKLVNESSCLCVSLCCCHQLSLIVMSQWNT